VKVYIISFTEYGKKLSNMIKKILTLHNHEICSDFAEVSFKEKCKTAFNNGEAIIFIGAIGIAVRGIAPYLQDKITDPAVIVVDDIGRNVIPILGGHYGGANELAIVISNGLLENNILSTSIITTSTDIHNVFAVDVWARKNEFIILNKDMIKVISGTLLKEQKVMMYTKFGIDTPLPKGIILENMNNISDIKSDVILEKKDILYSNILGSKKDKIYRNKHKLLHVDKVVKNVGINISIYKNKHYENSLNIVPQIISVGIGCRQGIDSVTIKDVLFEVLDKYNILKQAIFQISSIDLKKNEIGIIDICNELKVPFITYSSEKLMQIEARFTCSNFVMKTTGVDCVCERSAVMPLFEKGIEYKQLVSKYAKNGVTIALAEKLIRLEF